MAPDGEIPEHDPLAESTRRALQRMADASAVDVEPWGVVHKRGRRQRQLRIATAVAATVVVLAAGTAVVANTTGSSDHVSVAGPNDTTTSEPSESSTSSSAPPTTPPTSPVTCPPGACVAVPPPDTTPAAPSPAPQPADFTGTISANGDWSRWSMALGESVSVSALMTNVSDHEIEPSSSLLPTSLATVCTSTASGAQSLWWVTSPAVAPGGSTGRDGTFVPTDPYLGTVRSAVVVVTTNQQGTTFDTGAGGDDATATILAEVTAIAPLEITVADQPPPATTTTTTPVATTTTS